MAGELAVALQSAGTAVWHRSGSSSAAVTYAEDR